MAGSNAQGSPPQAARRRELIANIAACVGAALFGNLLTFLLRAFEDYDAIARPDWAPPGPLIGAVWLVLFAMHGAARGLLGSIPGAAAGRARLAVTVLVAHNVAYAVYALPFVVETRLPLLLGNLTAITLCAYAAGLAWPISRPAALLLLPMIAWVFFATVLLSGIIALEGL
ncbi:MAG: TspO/MBR family protein [Pseudomonadota bacterium]